MEGDVIEVEEDAVSAPLQQRFGRAIHGLTLTT